MTHQSRSNSVEDVALGSPSCSNSTESSQVYSLPLGLPSQIDICNEDQRLVSILNDLPIGPNPIIIDSNGVKIGTDFNVTVQGDAHFHTNLTGTEPPIPIPNGSCTDAARPQDNFKETPTASKKKLDLRSPKVLIVLASALFVILVFVISILWAVLHQANRAGEVTDLPSTTLPPDNGYFVSREGWSAMNPKSPLVNIPPALLAVVKHTGGALCLDQKACRDRVQEIQRDHMEALKLPDISYNFLIGGDVKIYVGRGWGTQNEGRNDSLDIAFIGNFSENIPTAPMLSLARRILALGPREKGLNYSHFCVVNHNQTEPTDSPGEYLFREIAKFSHYSSDIYYNLSSGYPIKNPTLTCQ